MSKRSFLLHLLGPFFVTGVVFVLLLGKFPFNLSNSQAFSTLFSFVFYVWSLISWAGWNTVSKVLFLLLTTGLFCLSGFLLAAENWWGIVVGLVFSVLLSFGLGFLFGAIKNLFRKRSDERQVQKGDPRYKVTEETQLPPIEATTARAGFKATFHPIGGGEPIVVDLSQMQSQEERSNLLRLVEALNLEKNAHAANKQATAAEAQAKNDTLKTLLEGVKSGQITVVQLQSWLRTNIRELFEEGATQESPVQEEEGFVPVWEAL